MKLGYIDYNGPAAYEIVDPESGKFYIGSTEDVKYRMRKHLTSLKTNTHKNKELNSIFNQNGGKFNIIIHKKDTKEEAVEYENKLLNENLNNPLNVNILKADGKHAEETKEKISETMTGLKRSDENRTNISKGKTGILFSESHKTNLSKAKSKPIEINGNIYNGLKDAIKKLNLSEKQLITRLDSTDERYKDFKRLWK
jgi:predicted GIY-YIG superfamily endonuclease